MKKKNIFSADEIIAHAQREILCELLHLLPQNGGKAYINKSHSFLDPNTGQGGSFAVESARLVNDFHDIEIVIHRMNADTATIDAQPENVVMKVIPGDTDNLKLFSLVCNEVQAEESITMFNALPVSARKGITDSLLMRSGTTVASGKTSKGLSYRLFACGDVRIIWKEQIYTDPQDYPEELVEVIRNHTIDNNPDANVAFNNWYELTIRDTYGKVIDSGLIDINLDEETDESLKSLILDTISTIG